MRCPQQWRASFGQNWLALQVRKDDAFQPENIFTLTAFSLAVCQLHDTVFSSLLGCDVGSQKKRSRLFWLLLQDQPGVQWPQGAEATEAGECTAKQVTERRAFPLGCLPILWFPTSVTFWSPWGNKQGPGHQCAWEALKGDSILPEEWHQTPDYTVSVVLCQVELRQGSYP